MFRVIYYTLFSLVASFLMTVVVISYAVEKSIVASVFTPAPNKVTTMYVSDFMFGAEFLNNLVKLGAAKSGDRVVMTIQSYGGSLDILEAYQRAILATKACVVGYVPKYAMSSGQLLAASVHRLIYEDDAMFLVHLPRYVNDRGEVVYLTSEESAPFKVTFSRVSHVLTKDELRYMLNYRDITLSGRTLRERTNKTNPSINPFTGVNNDIGGKCL